MVDPHRRFQLMLLAVLMCGLMSGPAWADTFTFSGTSTIGDDIANFFLGGPGIGLNSAVPSYGGSFLRLCNVNIPCALSDTVPASGSYWPALLYGLSGGGVAGAEHADWLVGSLAFTGDSILPSNGGTSPVTFTGHLFGYKLLGPVGNPTLGPQVFELYLTGQGTGTMYGFPRDSITYVVTGDTYTFNGAAIATPEPTTFLLVGSALAALGGLKRRQFLSWMRKEHSS